MDGIKYLTNQVNGKKLNIKRITTTINENNFLSFLFFKNLNRTHLN